jgi:hypothetical protein
MLNEVSDWIADCACSTPLRQPTGETDYPWDPDLEPIPKLRPAVTALATRYRHAAQGHDRRA